MDPDVEVSGRRVGRLPGGGPTLWKESLWHLPLGSLGARCKTSPRLWRLADSCSLLGVWMPFHQAQNELEWYLFCPVFVV